LPLEVDEGVGAAVEVVEVDAAGGEGEALVEGVEVTVVVMVDVTGAGALAEVAGTGVGAGVPALLWAAALVQPVRASATARSEPAVVRPRAPPATLRR
jgi:hypothetical protein